jgi:hypothetical protein
LTICGSRTEIVLRITVGIVIYIPPSLPLQVYFIYITFGLHLYDV